MANGSTYLPGGGEGSVRQWWGIYYWYVAVNADPLAAGRVKVRVPQVFGTQASGWASPMVPLTFVPEIGAPVAVMFVGGDPSQPVFFGNFAIPAPGTPTSVSTSPPASPTVGEIWYNSYSAGGVSGGDQMFVWNGQDTGNVTLPTGQVIPNGWVAYNIGSSALAPGSVVSGNVGATHFGLNMVNDPGFNQAALSAQRTASPTTGTWTITAGEATSTETNHTAIMYLTPPAALSLNTGEQYYLSVQVTSTGATGAVGIGIENAAMTASVNQAYTFTAAGSQAITGVVFGGVGFIRLYVTGSGTDTATVEFSSPVCQPAVLNSATINGGTITGAVFQGTDWIENSNGQYFYHGAPAVGNLPVLVLSNGVSTTDPEGNSYIPPDAVGTALPFFLARTASGVYVQVTAGTAANILLGSGDASEASAAVISTSVEGSGAGRQLTTSVSSPSFSSGDGQGLNLTSRSEDNVTATSSFLLGQDGTAQDASLYGGPDLNSGQAGPNVLTFNGYMGLTANQSAVPATPFEGFDLYADSAGNPSAVTQTGFSGQADITGRSLGAGQTVSSTSFVNLLSVAVAVATYKFTARLFLNVASSAGQWAVEVNGPTFSALDYNFKYESAAGVIGLNVARNTLSTALSGPATSVAGGYWVEIFGTCTTTASGHIVIAGKTTSASDTWTLGASSLLEVVQVG
jgi:hypothetical protein